jgi:hypothetical protein
MMVSGSLNQWNLGSVWASATKRLMASECDQGVEDATRRTHRAPAPGRCRTTTWQADRQGGRDEPAVRLDATAENFGRGIKGDCLDALCSRALRRLTALRERAEAETVTDEQCRALAVYSARKGRTWKAQAPHQWKAATPELHRLRNTLGPAWLDRFRVPEATDV